MIANNFRRDFMAKEIILIYNMPRQKEEAIQKLCLQLGVRIKKITPAQYSMPLGLLILAKGGSEVKGVQTPVPGALGTGIDHEMMILDGFTEKSLERFLNRYQQAGIAPVMLKAVLTEHNRVWSSLKLYRELCEEHKNLGGGQP